MNSRYKGKHNILTSCQAYIQAYILHVTSTLTVHFNLGFSGILSTCKFPGCKKPCYTEGDYQYDFCGRTHAAEYKKKCAAQKSKKNHVESCCHIEV